MYVCGMDGVEFWIPVRGFLFYKRKKNETKQGRLEGRACCRQQDKVLVIVSLVSYRIVLDSGTRSEDGAGKMDSGQS